MSNALLLTVCPFSRFLFSMHLRVLATTDAGAERPLFLYGNTFNRLPPMRLLRLTTAAGSDPTPPLGRSRWTRKQTRKHKTLFHHWVFLDTPGCPEPPQTTPLHRSSFFTLPKTLLDRSKTIPEQHSTFRLLQSHAGADQQRSHEGVERSERNPTFHVRNLPHPHT